MPRPSLLGAIICKAVAVGVDDAPDAQRLDLALLLGLVDDPFELSDRLNATDRRRMRARTELADETHAVWRRLPLDRAARARAALRLLQG